MVMGAGDGNINVGLTLDDQLSAALGKTTLLLFLGKAIKKSAQFEKAMADAQSVMMASLKDFNKMQSAILSKGGKTTITMTKMATALYDLASAGLSANEAMTVMQGTMKLAEATGADLSQTAQLVTKTIRAFGLEFTEANRVSEMFGTAVRNSQLRLEDITQAMTYANQIGATFRKQSLESVMTAMGVLANNGMKANQSMRMLRSIMTDLSKPTAKLNKFLKSTGLTLEDVSAENNSLVEILAKFNKVGADSVDVMQLFGKRSQGTFRILQRNIGNMLLFENGLKSQALLTNQLAVQMDTLTSSAKKLGTLYDKGIVIAFERTNTALKNMLQFITAIGTEIEGSGAAIATMQSIMTLLTGAGIGAGAGVLLQVVKSLMKFGGSVVAVQIGTIIASLGLLYDGLWGRELKDLAATTIENSKVAASLGDIVKALKEAKALGNKDAFAQIMEKADAVKIANYTTKIENLKASLKELQGVIENIPKGGNSGLYGGLLDEPTIKDSVETDTRNKILDTIDAIRLYEEKLKSLTKTNKENIVTNKQNVELLKLANSTYDKTILGQIALKEAEIEKHKLALVLLRDRKSSVKLIASESQKIKELGQEIIKLTEKQTELNNSQDVFGTGLSSYLKYWVETYTKIIKETAAYNSKLKAYISDFNKYFEGTKKSKLLNLGLEIEQMDDVIARFQVEKRDNKDILEMQKKQNEKIAEFNKLKTNTLGMYSKIETADESLLTILENQTTELEKQADIMSTIKGYKDQTIFNMASGLAPGMGSIFKGAFADGKPKTPQQVSGGMMSGFSLSGMLGSAVGGQGGSLIAALASGNPIGAIVGNIAGDLLGDVIGDLFGKDDNPVQMIRRSPLGDPRKWNVYIEKLEAQANSMEEMVESNSEMNNQLEQNRDAMMENTTALNDSAKSQLESYQNKDNPFWNLISELENISTEYANLFSSDTLTTQLLTIQDELASFYATSNSTELLGDITGTGNTVDTLQDYITGLIAQYDSGQLENLISYYTGDEPAVLTYLKDIFSKLGMGVPYTAVSDISGLGINKVYEIPDLVSAASSAVSEYETELAALNAQYDALAGQEQTLVTQKEIIEDSILGTSDALDELRSAYDSMSEVFQQTVADEFYKDFQTVFNPMQLEIDALNEKYEIYSSYISNITDLNSWYEESLRSITSEYDAQANAISGVSSALEDEYLPMLMESIAITAGVPTTVIPTIRPEDVGVISPPELGTLGGFLAPTQTVIPATSTGTGSALPTQTTPAVIYINNYVSDKYDFEEAMADATNALDSLMGGI